MNNHGPTAGGAAGRTARRLPLLGLTALVVLVAAGSAQRNQGLFSLIRDEAREHKLGEAEKLLENGQEAAAVELLLDVLRCSPSAVIDRGLDSHVGLREAARRVLARLSAEARTVYENTIAGEASPRLAEALRRQDPEELTRVALRYPSATPARRARLAAGDWFLEHGRILRALQEFALLGDEGDPSVRARRLACRAMLGLGISREALPKEPLPFGGDLLAPAAWLDRVRALRGLAQGNDVWPAYGGGLDGSRKPVDPVEPTARAWQETIYRGAEGRRYRPNLHPVADGRRVFVNTGTRLYGMDLLTGKSWHTIDHIAAIPNTYQQEQFLESVSQHFAHSAALGRSLVVAPLQVPIILDVAKENQNFNGIPIMRRLPVRRLHAFEAETGRLVWSHWERGRAPTADSALDVSGPPVIVDDTIYVATHKQLGTIAFYLSAFDLETGALRWRTLVCSSQIEVNMFGNAQQEYAASPLAYADGVIYGATNLGLCFSVRADDGSVRWLQSYRIIEIPPAQMRPEFRFVWWANNPPVVADGLVILTPIDSEDALALDAETGRLRWKLSYEVDDPTFVHRSYDLRWLLGIHDGKAWFSGQCILAKPIDGGPAKLLAWPQTLGQGPDGDSARSVPRGLLTDRHVYYVSVTGGLFVLGHDGQLATPLRRDLDPSEVGNLCSSGGVMVSVRPQYVNAYFSLDRLVQRARNDAAKNPNDPEPALAYAECFSARKSPTIEDLRSAARLYRKVLELCERAGQDPGSPVALRAKAGLFAKLRKLGDELELTQPSVSTAYRSEAVDLGRELHQESFLPAKDLIRYYARLLEHYRDDGDRLRDLLLDRLANNHGDDWYEFRGAVRTKVGAYVVVQRLDGMRDTEQNGARRLALLRRLLVEYGDAPLPVSDRGDVTGRAFAMSATQALLDRWGREVYAPYERQAEKLLASSGDDAGQLRAILDRFPLSETAERALVRLSTLAAKSGDLQQALQAYSFGLTRLPALPRPMLDAIAEAAARHGNRALSDAFRALAGGTWPGHRALARPRVLNGVPKQSRMHETRMATGYFPIHLALRDIAGFDAETPRHRLPLLLVSRDRVHAYRPKAAPEQPYSIGTPDFSVPFTPPLRELESVICGDVLILAEEQLVRGVSLATGKLLWQFRPDPAASVELAGPLAGGLYAVCRAPADPGLQTGRTITALEPLTGTPVFERHLESTRPPELGNGRLFHFVENARGQATLVVLDALSGVDADRLPLDGKGRPITQWAARNVLVTRNEIFLIVRLDSTHRRGDAGLWAFDRAKLEEGIPARKWHVQSSAVEEGDNFFVVGDEIILTLGFFTPDSAVWRLSRSAGERRPRILCGHEARVLGFPFGSDAAEIEPQPLLVVGQDSRNRAQLTLIDTAPGGVSWSVALSQTSSGDPTEDYPPPVYSNDVVVLGVPRDVNGNRYLNVLLFGRRTSEIVPAPGLRMKLWNPPGDLTTWNGQLILRSYRNGWIFGDMISGAGR